MTGPDRPSRRDPRLTGVEVWVTGPRPDVDAVCAALEAAGRIAYQSRAVALTGTDTGRVRRYLRLTTITAALPARAAAGPDLLTAPAA